MKIRALVMKCGSIFLAVLFGLTSASAQAIVSPTAVCPFEFPGGIQLPDEIELGPPYEVENGLRSSIYPLSYHALYGLGVFGVEANVAITVHYSAEYIGGYGPTYDSPLDVRYFALLNEQFLPLGGTQLYRDEVMPYRELFTLEVEIPPLTEDGVYDFILIGIPNPHLRSTEGDFDASVNTFSRRMTLVVGDPMLPVEDKRVYVDANAGIPNPDHPPVPEGVNRTSVWFDLYTDAIKPLDEPFTPGEIVSLNVELGQQQYFADYTYQNFVSVDDTPYVLLILDEYVPMAVGEDSATVVYARMPTGALFVEHPVTVTAPDKGIKDVVAVRIDYPGVPLCQYIDGSMNRLFGRRMDIPVD